VTANIDGDKLRNLRIRKGWTLEALAVRSGVSERAIQDIEKGATLHPRPNTVRWIAEALEVEPESLWSRPDPPQGEEGRREVRVVVVLRDSAGDPLSRWEIRRDQIRIGRDADNDVVLPERTVSLFHALLVQRDRQRDDVWELRDLGSANGTFVAGEPIKQPREVLLGASITVGLSTLQLCRPSQVASPTVTQRLDPR